jgi:hypothetical protein
VAKFFLDDALIISVNSRSKPACTSIVLLSPCSQDCSYKGVSKDKMWTYLGILFVTKIGGTSARKWKVRD